MPQEIPLTEDPRQTFRINLGDQDFRFWVWWQPSDEGWYVSLHHLDGTALTDGERLAAGSALLNGRGDLVSGAFTVEDRDVGIFPRELARDAWRTHRLVWYSSEELEP